MLKEKINKEREVIVIAIQTRMDQGAEEEKHARKEKQQNGKRKQEKKITYHFCEILVQSSEKLV